jgi:hypothetical protein
VQGPDGLQAKCGESAGRVAARIASTDNVGMELRQTSIRRQFSLRKLFILHVIAAVLVGIAIWLANRDKAIQPIRHYPIQYGVNR